MYNISMYKIIMQYVIIFSVVHMLWQYSKSTSAHHSKVRTDFTGWIYTAKFSIVFQYTITENFLAVLYKHTVSTKQEQLLSPLPHWKEYHRGIPQRDLEWRMSFKGLGMLHVYQIAKHCSQPSTFHRLGSVNMFVTSASPPNEEYF